jgi:hypothetical protein
MFRPDGLHDAVWCHGLNLAISGYTSPRHFSVNIPEQYHGVPCEKRIYNTISAVFNVLVSLMESYLSTTQYPLA